VNYADALLCDLVLACNLPHHHRGRKLTRFTDDDSASLSKKWTGHKAHRPRLVPTLGIHWFCGISAIKCALADRSCHWQDKCFASRWARSLMSRAMTCLSSVSDTTHVQGASECGSRARCSTTGAERAARRRIMVSEDHNRGVTRHDVSVTVTDTQPQLRFATPQTVFSSTASTLHN